MPKWGFTTGHPDEMLDTSDAAYIDVIHTDLFGHGIQHAAGHVDFYVNADLKFQPGCEMEEFGSE